eukprot:jgi/Chrzof1/7494/Cz02g25290.t1
MHLSTCFGMTRHAQEDDFSSGVVARQWYFKFSQTWRTMAQALGLKRLQELIQGTSALTTRPAWLLGTWYGVTNQDTDAAALAPEVEAALVADFGARLWFTYRKGFSPLGPMDLTSDVGWGCTLRSGQMMLAEALLRHMHGRLCCRPSDNSGADAYLQVVRLFLDTPSPDAPFSIHNLCAAGSPHGVVAGQWLGPWVLCKALEAAVAAAPPQLCLAVHVVCDPGGGAPSISMHRVLPLLEPSQTATSTTSPPKQQQHRHGQVDSDMGTAGPSGRGDVQEQQRRQQQQQQPPDTYAQTAAGKKHGLLLLVPLTLGVGKVSERYLPQLQRMLTFPQSVGIVGGRPSASLYFVGFQDSNIMYLDPHEVQEAAELPQDLFSFFYHTPRLMPLPSIDPSIAIGFYCSTQDDFKDLCGRLESLASQAGSTPVVTITSADTPEQPASYADAEAAVLTEDRNVSDVNAAQSSARAAAGDDWELV